jgi:hypothetical protein
LRADRHYVLGYAVDVSERGECCGHVGSRIAGLIRAAAGINRTRFY